MECLRFLTSLADVGLEYGREIYEDFLLEGEKVEFSFKSEEGREEGRPDIGYRAIFTDKRIIAVFDFGKERTMHIIPFSKIVAYFFSFIPEEPSSLNLDSHIRIWLSEVGKVEFEFSSSVHVESIRKIGILLSQHI